MRFFAPLRMTSVAKSAWVPTLLRAFIVGVVWYVFPLWVFVLAALYVYLIPFFRPGKLLLPFFVTLALGAFIPMGAWGAVVLTVLLFLILGIKDLILVERPRASILLFLLLLLSGLTSLFEVFGDGFHIGSAVASGVVALVFFLLARGLFSRVVGDKKAEVLFAVTALFLWQGSAVLFFLPLNFLYQAAILFLVTSLLVAGILDYEKKAFSRHRVLLYASVLFAALTLTLTAAPFGL